MDTRKNVLLISVDQFAAKRLGVFGNKKIMTPTIDFLARNGLNFTNAYSTCPICIPARRTLMTGLSPKTHGDRVYNDMLPMPDVKTLAQCFVDAGYQAYAVGKLHVYPQRSRIGFNDVILMEEGRNEWGVYDDYQIWLGEEGYISKQFNHTEGNNRYYTRPWHLPEEAHETTWAANQMLKMIARKDPDKPAFYYMSFSAPHPPLVPLKEYYDMYTTEEMELPEVHDNWSSDDSYIMKYQTGLGSFYSEKERKMCYRAYYAQVTHIDNEIRQLIGCLRENNMLNNTVIVFLADHGDMMFEHNCIEKRLFYEGSANIPLIISGTPVQEYRGKVDEQQLACLEDVMPTLLDICGIDIPDSVEGISLLSSKKRDYIFGEITEGVRATRMIREGDFKLIYYPCGNVFQMFDMKNDRNEDNNIADNPNYKDVFDKLSAHLIENLHSGDENWVKDGKLVGFEEPKEKQSVDFGMHNQRGTHWPPLGKYSNFGN